MCGPRYRRGGPPVTAERTAVYEPSFPTELALDSQTFATAVVESGYLSLECEVITADAILALISGETDEILSEFPYEAVSRPIYPLDEDID